MTTNLIRCQTKPEPSDENEGLINQVSEDLRTRAPEGPKTEGATVVGTYRMRRDP